MEIIFTSTLLSALVAGIVAAWTLQRKIGIENITQDRRTWREKIRERALSVHDALVSRDQEALNKLRAEFRAILNPTDKEDIAILTCIDLPEEGRELECAEEFSKRIALLLKHDWERVKLEAGPFFKKVKPVRKWIGALLRKPKRIKYK